MCLTLQIIVSLCLRPQVSLSPYLESLVRMRESFVVHAVSSLVLIVLYTCVIVVTTEFRYSELTNHDNFRLFFCNSFWNLSLEFLLV